MASSAYQSSAAVTMAQTAVLGDSQGSIAPLPPTRPAFGDTEDDNMGDQDEAVGSGLGGSYVDGAKRAKAFVQQPDEDEDLEDGGVLGLLAQIYGGRGGLPS
jgi:autophagy-related protein 9